MIQTIKTYGRLVVDPKPLNNNTKDMFKPWWVIIQLECEIDKYYSWFFKKEKGLLLQKPAWGPHVSVVRGEECEIELWEKMKKKYDQKNIEFEYELIPKTNGKHVWMRVLCDELTELRKSVGLEKHWIGNHLTLGIPIPRHREHLEYLYKIQW